MGDDTQTSATAAHRRLDEITKELPVFDYRLKNVEAKMAGLEVLNDNVTEMRVKLDLFIKRAEEERARRPTAANWITIGLSLMTFLGGLLASFLFRALDR